MLKQHFCSGGNNLLFGTDIFVWEINVLLFGFNIFVWEINVLLFGTDIFVWEINILLFGTNIYVRDMSVPCIVYRSRVLQVPLPVPKSHLNHSSWDPKCIGSQYPRVTFWPRHRGPGIFISCILLLVALVL